MALDEDTSGRIDWTCVADDELKDFATDGVADDDDATTGSTVTSMSSESVPIIQTK
jgi:hypothetical protein